jgi:hypothetical protein
MPVKLYKLLDLTPITITEQPSMAIVIVRKLGLKITLVTHNRYNFSFYSIKLKKIKRRIMIVITKKDV